MNEPDNSDDSGAYEPHGWNCGCCARDAENNIGVQHSEGHETTLRDDEEL